MKQQLTLIKYVILAFVIFSGCAYNQQLTRVRQHPDFANSSRKINNITIIPPDVEVTYLVFNGDNQRLTEDESNVNVLIDKEYNRILTDKGYTIKPFEFLQTDGQDDFRFNLNQLKKAYNEASTELYENRMVKRELSDDFKVSIGPIVNQFSDIADCDALVIARYSGFKKSKGLIAKQATSSVLLGVLTGVVSVQPSKGCIIEIALVDGTTGDILWSNVEFGNDTSSSYSPSTVINKAIDALPALEEEIPESQPMTNVKKDGENTNI